MNVHRDWLRPARPPPEEDVDDSAAQAAADALAAYWPAHFEWLRRHGLLDPESAKRTQPDRME